MHRNQRYVSTGFGIIGSLQAMETLKLLTNYGKIISGKVLLYDAMSTEFRTINLMPDPNCEVCQAITI